MSGKALTKKGKKRKPEEGVVNAETCEGKSLREIMEFRLDQHVHSLMTWDGDHDVEEEHEAFVKRQGEATGVAWCIALILNPFYPDANAVRDEAMERYYESNPEVEED